MEVEEFWCYRVCCFFVVEGEEFFFWDVDIEEFYVFVFEVVVFLGYFFFV